MKKIFILAILLLGSICIADTPPPANTDHLKEGVTNLYLTNPRVDARISLQKGAANGLATLDGSGKVPSAQLPSTGSTWGAITGTLSNQTDLQSALNAKYDASNPSSYVNASGAASAAPVQSVAGKIGTVILVKGDVGLGNVDNTSDANKPISTATQAALNAKYDASNPSSYVNAAGASASAPVQSVAGKIGVVSLVKGDVGLGNVDNTSDANKPISTATQTALNTKEPAITTGTSAQVWFGDKVFRTLNTLAVPELTNLYYTQARFDSAFAGKSTTNLAEGSNLYYTTGRVDSEFDTRLATKSTSNLSEGSNLYYTNARVDSEFDTRLATKTTTNLAEGTNLYFTDARAINAVFSRLNYITNPDAEVDTSGWNLYDDSGRTVSAFVVDQDITYTSTTSGNGGNGQTVTYSLGSSPYVEPPTITCPTGNSVSVTWYNGPTLAQNPTATVLKAAWDASCAATMATATITGIAGNRQYQVGTVTLAQGGDTAPVDGTGGSPTNLTFTRSTSAPLVGIASFDLGKGASSQQGSGVSTDFAINSADRGNTLQLSLYYSGSAAFTFGASSDTQVYLFDKTNTVMLPLTKKTFTGTTGNVYRFAAQFTASATSTDYRLIFHVATTNASAWDLKLDSVTVDATLDAAAATDVPKLMLNSQPINGSVTDHMAVMWTDGALAWVPATMGSATDFTTLYGFATNIVGLTANITLRGALNGFSFGPFVGYNQYVDVTAGGISPLPASFTDAYVVMGKGLSSDTIMVEPKAFNRLVTSKGGLLTNGGLNNGTGDVVLAGGTTGQYLMGNAGLTNGLQWTTPVATSPITYTASTHTWSLGTVPVANGGTGLTSTSQNFGFFGPTSGSGAPTWRLMVAADVPTLNQNTTGSAATLTTARTIAGTSFNGSANISLANKFIVQGTADAGLSGPQFLGALGTGIVKNTTTTGVLSIAVAGDFPTLNQNTSGSAASFTGSLAGDVTGTQGATAISAATVTGKLLTGFVSGSGTVAATDTVLQGINKLNGNDALKAPLASPTFTGDVNSSTGNVLVSTIGKGLQVKTGTNAKIGTAVLVGGTVTVANTSVTANSRIFLTSNTDGGTPGSVRVSAKVNGTSFTITSLSALDTSTIAWMIVESIP